VLISNNAEVGTVRIQDGRITTMSLIFSCYCCGIISKCAIWAHIFRFATLGT